MSLNEANKNLKKRLREALEGCPELPAAKKALIETIFKDKHEMQKSIVREATNVCTGCKSAYIGQQHPFAPSTRRGVVLGARIPRVLCLKCVEPCPRCGGMVPKGELFEARMKAPVCENCVNGWSTTVLDSWVGEGAGIEPDDDGKKKKRKKDKTAAEGETKEPEVKIEAKSDDESEASDSGSDEGDEGDEASEASDSEGDDDDSIEEISEDEDEKRVRRSEARAAARKN